MNWKEHLKYGAIPIIITTMVLLVATQFFDLYILNIFGMSNIELIIPIPNLLLAFLFGMYALLLPDVDIGTSKAFMITYILLIAVILYFAVFTDYLLPIVTSAILMVFILGLKHRGIAHRWYSGVAVGCVFAFVFGYLTGIFIIVGYLTHLALDINPHDKRRKKL